MVTAILSQLKNAHQSGYRLYLITLSCDLFLPQQKVLFRPLESNMLITRLTCRRLECQWLDKGTSTASRFWHCRSPLSYYTTLLHITAQSDMGRMYSRLCFWVRSIRGLVTDENEPDVLSEAVIPV